MTTHAKLFTDGGARGNPGPAGSGAWLQDVVTGEKIAELALYLGEQTNNYAEYMALIEGMRLAKEKGVTHLDVHMDSQLIVEQMKGNYKVKNPGLKTLNAQAQALVVQFAKLSFTHIPREQNKEADRLVNAAIDRGIAKPE